MAIDPDRQPRVLIYGAGAVGCFLGGVLAEAGCSVTLLARGDLVRTVSENGLALERPGSTSHVWQNCVESIDQIEHTPDLIFLTVRTFSVERALDEIAYVYGPGTTLITVQNGVGTEDLVRTRLPDVPLIATSLTLSAEF